MDGARAPKVPTPDIILCGGSAVLGEFHQFSPILGDFKSVESVLGHICTYDVSILCTGYTLWKRPAFAHTAEPTARLAPPRIHPKRCSDLDGGGAVSGGIESAHTQINIFGNRHKTVTVVISDFLDCFRFLDRKKRVERNEKCTVGRTSPYDFMGHTYGLCHPITTNFPKSLSSTLASPPRSPTDSV